MYNGGQAFSLFVFVTILYAAVAVASAHYTPEPAFTDLGTCEARVKEMNTGTVRTCEYKCEEQAND